MPKTWTNEFGTRMSAYQLARPPGLDERAVSIKVRVSSGCFHIEHSPNAYRIIEAAVQESGREAERPFDFIEHESGPEILVYVAVTTAGISLAKSVIDLVVTILKARSEGIRKGDKPAEPLELVVRRSIDSNRVDEEIVLRIGYRDPVNPERLEESLVKALDNLIRKKGEHDGTG